MFGSGHIPELLILLAVVLIIFGPSKLPDVGRGMGRAINEFRHAMQEPTTPGHGTTDSTAVPAPSAPNAFHNADSGDTHLNPDLRPAASLETHGYLQAHPATIPVADGYASRTASLETSAADDREQSPSSASPA